jgi:hypothetical protein
MIALNIWRYSRNTKDWTENLYSNEEFDSFEMALARFMYITQGVKKASTGKFLIEVIEWDDERVHNSRSIITSDEMPGYTS